MNVRDVMTARIIGINPAATIAEAGALMLQNGVSALLVIDRSGELVGILSEGDLLERCELGTERKKHLWLEMLFRPGRLTGEYLRSHSCRVEDVMTRDVITATEDMPIEDVVKLMMENRIKRLPVMRGRRPIGVLSRADLVRVLVKCAGESRFVSRTDEEIRSNILTELRAQSWAPAALVTVDVKNGIVDLWGSITDERQREPVRVLVENVPGVKAVHDHLVWIEPISGTVGNPPADRADSAEP
ncbi:MAG: CBS domain-containing protein [Hyphomicrobiaceae bacterium]|mgnify:CR=1 FL=1|nr:MAG: histidine kinase [Alphaproteobacteria bacterium]